MSKTTPVADRAADPSPVVQVTLTEFLHAPLREGPPTRADSPLLSSSSAEPDA